MAAFKITEEKERGANREAAYQQNNQSTFETQALASQNKTKPHFHLEKGLVLTKTHFCSKLKCDFLLPHAHLIGMHVCTPNAPHYGCNPIHS